MLRYKAILVVCGLFHGRAFQLDICGDQRLADGIVLVSLDVGCHDLAADGKKFGFKLISPVSPKLCVMLYVGETDTA